MAQAQQEWDAYRNALSVLSSATLDVGERGSAPDEDAVDEVLRRSDALGAALGEHLGVDSFEEREMAALQLVAAAAVDLDQANRLAAIDDDEPLEATLSSQQWDEIDRILATPTEKGIYSVLNGTATDGYQATVAESKTLKQVVDEAIEAIAADASKAAGTTVKGLTGIPGDDLLKALGDGVEDLFKRVGDKVNWLKRKALALVLRAVRKLLAIFGTSTDAVRKKIEEWIDDLDEDKINGLLQRLYGVKGLKSRFATRIDSASQGIPGDREKAAREELVGLQARWHKRAQIIDTLGGLVPFARKWVAALVPPWGLLAYSAAFLSATGYVVFAGGDYLDWREDDGVLDLVEGVGAIVDRAVAPTRS